MSETVLLDVRDGLARLTLNRPSSLNAMDFEMGRRWREATHRVVGDPEVRAVILDATGPAFCAGGDVIAMSGEETGVGKAITAMAHVIQDGIRALVTSSIPVVASVHGAVAGGGLGLMLAADYIVAGERARFVSRYANIGLTPDLGVSTLLPAAIGQSRALRLLLQDETIDAATALDWGLVSEVVPEPAARAEEVARFWLDGASAAFGQAKRLVRAGVRRSFEENLADEAATIGASSETDAARARIAAFAASARSATKEKP